MSVRLRPQAAPASPKVTDACGGLSRTRQRRRGRGGGAGGALADRRRCAHRGLLGGGEFREPAGARRQTPESAGAAADPWHRGQRRRRRMRAAGTAVRARRPGDGCRTVGRLRRTGGGAAAHRVAAARWRRSRHRGAVPDDLWHRLVCAAVARPSGAWRVGARARCGRRQRARRDRSGQVSRRFGDRDRRQRGQARGSDPARRRCGDQLPCRRLPRPGAGADRRTGRGRDLRSGGRRGVRRVAALCGTRRTDHPHGVRQWCDSDGAGQHRAGEERRRDRSVLGALPGLGARAAAAR